jgi:molybdopterin molybdotransferase
VLSAGCRLDAQHLGALAELGRDSISVLKRPRVAVLATGDELVPIHDTPGPGQIRNSNETMLVAQIQRAGAQPIPLGISGDNRRQLGERVAVGLEHDVLLLSGGVSAGQLDLVPAVLESAGVENVFHHVKIKPGKPVWFGVRPATDHRSHCLVFGLPGNPVSSMVSFELLARTAISRMCGLQPGIPRPLAARLTKDHLAGGDRPTYHPAHLYWTQDGWEVRAVRWMGSADLRATVEANAMICFPASQRTISSGELVDVIPWDNVPMSGKS